jgi:hypothetical protein
MTRARVAIWVFAASILLAPAASLAQEASGDSFTVLYPKWDAGGGFAFVFAASEGGASPFRNEEFAAWHLDFGRYITTHVKADLGVALTSSYSYFDGTRVPAPGLPRDVQYLEFVYQTERPTSVSGAVTYQFFENAFVHPYVSGGLRMTWRDERLYRDRESVTVRGVRYEVPGVDIRRTSFITRPLAGVGCKSYFDAHVFMRSEALIAFGPHGYSDATLRIGAGIDF